MMKKEYRVAQCLTENGVREFAIFTDGTPKEQIRKDEQGNKYFHITNPYTKTNSYFEKHFYNRIKDAITAVRDGYADAILCKSQDVGGFINTVCFLDKKVAQEYREKTLEGWKNTKFAFAVKAGNKNSFNGYNFITAKSERLGMGSNTLKYATFETEKEADAFVQSLIEKARGYVQRLADGEEFHSVWDCLEAECGKFSVVSDFAYDLCNQQANGFAREDKSLEEFGYSIVQCVIPEREDIVDNEWWAKAFFLFPVLMDKFAQYKSMKYAEAKQLIVDVFKGFYEKNSDGTNLNNETTVELDTDVQNFLFENWLNTVNENMEFMYPAA